MSNSVPRSHPSVKKSLRPAPEAGAENLRRLNRLAGLGTLSASMAHEIKNALVAGKTFVELLLEQNKGNELAGTVRHELERIDSIVSQMLKFSAPRKEDFAKISLHDTLGHSLRLITPKLQSKSVTLNRYFEATADVIEGDAYQLQQAFVNLFLNSLEAMPFEGALTVATEPTASTPQSSLGLSRHKPNPALVKITISDTGSGISAENMARIFEPFFTTRKSGTGLGLAITRGIIEEHGGEITVESEPKKGAKFIILLPLLP